MYAEAEKNFDSRKKSDSDEDTQSTQVILFFIYRFFKNNNYITFDYFNN